MYMVLLLQKQMLLTYVRKGWEASISWNDSFNLKGKAFHYSVVLGLADNTTKVTKYNNDNKTLGTPYEGQQLGEFGDMLLMVSSKLMKKLKLSGKSELRK